MGGAAGSTTGNGGATGSGGAGGSGTLPTNTTENTGADALKTAAAARLRRAHEHRQSPRSVLDGERYPHQQDQRLALPAGRDQLSDPVLGFGAQGSAPTASASCPTYSGGKLTVTVTQSGATITLTSTITTPSGSGPFPLVIGMNAPTGSLPSSLFGGVATMTFTTQLVPDAFNVTRGAGAYFTMYPDKNAGAMIEWAWGVSRLIDGIYATAAENKIDLARIAVTGCSFQGKMALYAGAFDERIALTIPEESGGGGEASWRFDATEQGTEDLEHAQGTA